MLTTPHSSSIMGRRQKSPLPPKNIVHYDHDHDDSSNNDSNTSKNDRLSNGFVKTRVTKTRRAGLKLPVQRIRNQIIRPISSTILSDIILVAATQFVFEHFIGEAVKNCKKEHRKRLNSVDLKKAIHNGSTRFKDLFPTTFWAYGGSCTQYTPPLKLELTMHWRAVSQAKKQRQKDRQQLLLRQSAEKTVQKNPPSPTLLPSSSSSSNLQSGQTEDRTRNESVKNLKKKPNSTSAAVVSPPKEFQKNQLKIDGQGECARKIVTRTLERQAKKQSARINDDRSAINQTNDDDSISSERSSYFDSEYSYSYSSEAEDDDNRNHPNPEANTHKTTNQANKQTLPINYQKQQQKRLRGGGDDPEKRPSDSKSPRSKRQRQQ